MRTSPILGLLICSAIIVNMVEAKPLFIKIFAPSSGYSYQSTPTVAPANTQFISNLISTKFQLLNSLLQAKSSFGGFGITKSFSFNGQSTTTTTTEKPFTVVTTEVNTDYIPEVSSSTQSVPTTTTEDDFETPKPTVRPQPPVPTSKPVNPVTSTTEDYVVSSTTEDSAVETTTRDIHGYSYTNPSSNFVRRY